METNKNRTWWFIALKGILFIIFGVLAVLYPGETISTVTIYLGLVILITGIIFLIGAIMNIRHKRPWEVWMLEAIIDIALGILFIFYPEWTLKFFTTLIGAWAVILGIYQLITYFKTRKVLGNNSLYLYNGIFAVVLGLLFIFNPFGPGKIVTVLIGIFAIIFGVNVLVMGINLRKGGQAKLSSEKTDH